jgi:caa(3)-type oxidase subunit IV
MARIMEMSPTAAKITVLVTAFGIAFVKAYFVIAYFMHLKFEIKYVQYMLGTTVVFMLLFFSAVAPDVMRHDGACQRWAEVEGKKVCKIYSWTNSAAPQRWFMHPQFRPMSRFTVSQPLVRLPHLSPMNGPTWVRFMVV